MGYCDRNQVSGNRSMSNGGGQKREKIDLTYAPTLENFTFYTNGKITEKLFDDIAENISKTFIGKNSEGHADHVSATQVRKIYDEVKGFEKYFISSTKSDWEEKKPYIKMLKSKVAYTVARKGVTKGVYKNFEKFISDCVNQTKEEKDYFVFLSLFEAVYGFYTRVLLENGFKLND